MISLPDSPSSPTESLLREILSTSREAFVAETPDGLVAAANPRFLELAGWTGCAVGHPLDEIIAAWASQVSAPAVLQSYFCSCRGAEPPEGPRELQPNPGQVIEARVLPLGAANGFPHRVWFFQEWRTSALAWVSHEIKNPLNAILGFSELLDESLSGEASPGVRTSLRGLRASARQLQSVLADLLDLSRFESGVVRVQPRWTALSTVFEDLETLFRPRFERQGLAFRVQMPGGPGREFWTDPGRLSQILGNLLVNALNHTHCGGVILGAAWAADSWELTVEDTGAGIPVEQQAEIFEPFVQKGAPNARKNGGTGLGLAICRTLAHSLGGTMGLVSEPGVGSRFSVSFDHVRSRIAGSSSPPSGSTQLPPATILVADDEPTNHLLIREFLRGSPVTVLSASDGKEAVALWKRHRPSVVLLDSKMPGLSGPDAARRIRALDPKGTTRLLAMSSARGPAGQNAGSEAPWSGFLEKPFTRQDLLIFLSNHITFVDEFPSSS